MTQDAPVDLSLAVTPAPLRKQLEDKLRQAIVRGHFKPGEHLSDRVLCETFQISRTVVREAVRQLEAEGLIETLPHRGSFVKAMSVREAEQVYDVRGVLEALAARGFTRNAAEVHRRDLAQVHEDLKAIGRGERDEDVLAVKQRFYEVLLTGCGNEYVTRMLNQILNRNTLLRATSLSDPGRLPATVAEIGRLMEAIDRRDEDAAWEASLAHVRSAAAVALAVLRRQEAAARDAGKEMSEAGEAP